MPYSYGLVTFNSEPALVPDELIAALRRHMEVVNAADDKLFDGMKHGEPVSIQGGPFMGYEAIFDAKLAGSERVHVLLLLLNKDQISLELQASQIKRIKRR